MANWKIGKILYDRQCDYCSKILHKGENALILRTRLPIYENNKQVGINYLKLYTHLSYDDCLNNNQNEHTTGTLRGDK